MDEGFDLSAERIAGRREGELRSCRIHLSRLPCPAVAFCRQCGAEIADDSAFCARCGCSTSLRSSTPKKTTNTSTNVKVLLWLLVILLALIVFNAATNPSGGLGTSSSGSVVPPSSLGRDDAELLISRCGNPDVDDSTAYDNPRPPIPTRMVTYKKAHLRFAYIPRDSQPGKPPPYRWKMLGIVDTRNESAVTAATLKATLTKRLPCSLPH